MRKMHHSHQKQSEGEQGKRIDIRVTNDPSLVEAAQRVRYKVFYDEYGAKPTPEMVELQRDFDKYDSLTDHLVVIDHDNEDVNHGVIGTYRLLRASKLPSGADFYTSGEFNIDKIKESSANLLELGRSCVLPEYRTRPVLQYLWEGIAAYLADHKIDLMFGCASFNGTDVKEIQKQLSYLYHYHLAPDSLRPVALESLYIDMNILPKNEIAPEARKIFATLPPLIKGYLRVGVSIGDGAIIDEQFNTIDVCIVLPTHLVTERYLKHYQRKTQGQMPTDSQFAKEMRENGKD